MRYRHGAMILGARARRIDTTDGVQTAQSSEKSMPLYKQMHALLVQALNEDPRSAATHDNLGAVCVQMGDLASGIASFEQAIDLNPNDPCSHLNLGTSLQRRGQLSFFECQYEHPTELEITSACSDLEAPIQCFERAIALDSLISIGVGDLSGESWTSRATSTLEVSAQFLEHIAQDQVH